MGTFMELIKFATGSREKTIKIWAVENGHTVKQPLTLPSFKSSVTALSWTGLTGERNHGSVAEGMESGLVELWSLSYRRSDDGNAPMPNTTCVGQFDPFLCHVSFVHRLTWRTCEKNQDF